MIRKLISGSFDGEAIPKIQKKIKIIQKGHYKYMAAFLADQVKGLATSTTEINTPFGTVTVKKTGDSDCIISKDGAPGDYKRLSSHLDTCYFNNEGILTTIYNYLSMPYISSVTNIEGFNREVIDARTPDDYLAVFCGILMVAEPLRFGDGGGLSRSKIRKIFKFMKGGKIKNPYSVVFADASQIIDLGTDKDKEGLAVFSHVDGATQKAVREGKAKSASPGSDKRKWRSKCPDPNFIPGGKKQQLNQIAGSPGYDESQASFDDNLKRTHHFDKDVSDDEDIKEEIDEAKCKLCHKFYKLGTNRDILLCGSCREKEEGKKFLSLIENNQLEVAEKYVELLLSSIYHEYAAMFYNLLTSFDEQTADRFYTLLKAKKLSGASMFFGIVMMDIQYSDLIWQVATNYSDTITCYYATILEYCHKFNDLKYSNQFLAFIQNGKIQEAEEFYIQYFTD
ncbi:MAG: hypothetical protein Q4B84_01415 [Clostridia bacterium]|nr:hypothetical protein [Clostridia bacterium]